MPPWERIKETGDQIEDAFGDFELWRSWLEDKAPGLLDCLDTRHQAELYAAFCDVNHEGCREGCGELPKDMKDRAELWSCDPPFAD